MLPDREVPGPGRRSDRLALLSAFFVAGVLAASLARNSLADPALLPPEEAFRFGARALDTRTVEALFAISDGYYLYRDRLRFKAIPSLGFRAPPLPPGQVKDDPFFGRVETYRGEVSVKLVLPDAVPGTEVAIEAESQGCAEAGVCYPPHRQRVTLAMPVEGAGPGPLVEANPARMRWFR